MHHSACVDLPQTFCPIGLAHSLGDLHRSTRTKHSMNPYDPPQTVDDDTLDVDVIQTEGNSRVFAAGVSMVVVGVGLILFCHLAQSFAGEGQSPPIQRDWLYWFIGLGVILMHFRGQIRRCRTKPPTGLTAPSKENPATHLVTPPNRSQGN